MKLIIAYLPPERLTQLINALCEKHVHGLSVSEVRGFGQEHDPAHPDHREFIGIELTPKLRLEIACHDEEVDALLQVLRLPTDTGQRGAGKIFILPIQDALRLKTGERGSAALGKKLN